MPNETTHNNQAHPESLVKTLSLPEMAFLLLRACDLPYSPTHVNDLLHSLARKRLAILNAQPIAQKLKLSAHLEQYL